MSDPYNLIGRYSGRDAHVARAAKMARCVCEGWLGNNAPAVCNSFDPKHSGDVSATSHCDNCQHDMRCHV